MKNFETPVMQARKARIEHVKRLLTALHGNEFKKAKAVISMEIGAREEKVQEYLNLLREAEFFSIDEKTKCINCEVIKDGGINERRSEGLGSGSREEQRKNRITFA